ncbi:hypothetical protein [Acidisoma sp. C75]
MSMMITAPTTQLQIARGPAIFAAWKLPNSQPDPIMLVTLAKRRPMILASLRNVDDAADAAPDEE